LVNFKPDYFDIHNTESFRVYRLNYTRYIACTRDTPEGNGGLTQRCVIVFYHMNWLVCSAGVWGPIYTLRLCRMRQVCNRSTTWIVSCKSNLKLAYECPERQKNCRGILKHVLKRCNNRSPGKLIEMTYLFCEKLLLSRRRGRRKWQTKLLSTDSHEVVSRKVCVGLHRSESTMGIASYTERNKAKKTPL